MLNKLIQGLIGALALIIVIKYIIPLIPSVFGIPLGLITLVIVLIVAVVWILRLGGVS